MTRMMALGVVAAVLADPAWAEVKDAGGSRIALPSGAVATWQETVRDTSGGTGLTYRFRFVIPDLASRVPATSGPASDDEELQDMDRGPIDIDTETAEVEGAPASPPAADYVDDAAAQPEVVPDDEAAADTLVDAPALPAAPDVLAQDPVHDDVVWLCQEWVLPRIAAPGPRPRQIIISLADKAVPFGSYDPDVLQLFEAFALPPDRDACLWEPW